ncbi:hypothetical protein OAN61_01070, partial [bacterium]|nr:hypothetical protein [bacterium]
MARYADRNFVKHQRAWCRFWRRYCDACGIQDPWEYNMHAAIDCLTWVQRRSAAYATAKGVPEQHSTFKEARAAISAFWKLVHPSTDFAEEPHVKAVAIGLRRTNPLLKAYSDTWDITIIFEHIFEMARRGEYLRDLPHY